MQEEPLVFELSQTGRQALCMPTLDVPSEITLPADLQRTDLPLPELSEIDVVRHFTALSRRNFGVDTGFYPLGSCTMKYNPKINEEAAAMDGFANLHPLQDESQIQGMLELLYDFEHYLCAIFGYDAFSLQPAAGAHGEVVSLMMIKAYHQQHNEGARNEVIIPDSAHGTNPASVSMVGYKAIQVKSNNRGEVDLDELKKHVNAKTAALMMTNPNTLGLFESQIIEIAKIVHAVGGLLYYDGANANAIMHKAKPAVLGFDVAHFNLHKTFSTPHGGGGPGSGPIGVNQKLVPFLPVPCVKKNNGGYSLSNDRSKNSIGRVHSYYGNIGIILRAYAYIRSLGHEGLKEVSEQAVLSANYIKEKIKGVYYLPQNRWCMHEFVISAKWQKEKYGVRALDIAKRLIDYGFHPPTIYFPLIVEEAIMIEPTETESRQTLDVFINAMLAIAKECEENADLVKYAPYTTPVKRLDETKAARQPKLQC